MARWPDVHFFILFSLTRRQSIYIALYLVQRHEANLHLIPQIPHFYLHFCALHFLRAHFAYVSAAVTAAAAAAAAEGR